MILELSIAITAILVFLLGLVVYVNDPKNRQNIYFCILSIAGTSWLFSNFFVLLIPNELFFQRLITPTSVLSMLTLLYFVEAYSRKNNTISSVTKVLTALSIPILVLSFTDFNVYVTSSENIELGSLYPFYIVYIISCTLLLIWRIIQGYKSSSVLIEKEKTNIAGLGIALTVIPTTILGVLLPAFGVNIFLDITPIFVIIFFSLSSYAILQRRLFDIRYVVWRLVTYSISIAIITIMLTLGVYFGVATVLGYDTINYSVQPYYIATTIVIILLFEPLKRWVDKITNTVFFQQKYSVHETLSKTSNFITRNIDTHKIQKFTIKTFDETISPTYCAFLIYDKEGHLQLENISNDQNSNKRYYQLKSVLSNISHIKDNLKTYDEIDYKSALKKTFELCGINITARLATHNKSIGYLVLGHKKSGTSYSRHDLQLVKLVANDLALSLENAQRYEEIKAFNVTLQNKVNEATKALKRTNAKLIALDDAKDEFISMASHQLRTPLTSIKGYISMLLEEDLGKLNKTQKQALKEAFDSSQRMVFLISDFLNVSRIRTGKFIIEPSQTNIARIVDEEIAQLRDMAGLRGQKISYKAPKKIPMLWLDENKIRQVMMNMLDNAIYYTPKGGEITIVLEKDKDTITYKVIDTGIGVPLKEQHRLFTKFFRAKNARSARPDGTGLGLFMAQKIITAQGGKIIFKSEEGKGSTFGFSFPYSSIDKNESVTV